MNLVNCYGALCCSGNQLIKPPIACPHDAEELDADVATEQAALKVRQPLTRQSLGCFGQMPTILFSTGRLCLQLVTGALLSNLRDGRLCILSSDV